MKKIITLVLLVTSFIACNKEGCTDPIASNYNADAKTDDGTCTIEGCTDPIAVNYDFNANVSMGCIYDQVGSWTMTRQEAEISSLVIYLGDTILDENYTEVVPSDSLDPVRVDFLADGTGIMYHLDGDADVGVWTISNNIITWIYDDGSTDDIVLDSVSSDFMRLTSSYSEVDNSDPDSFVSYSLNYFMEFSRN